MKAREVSIEYGWQKSKLIRQYKATIENLEIEYKNFIPKEIEDNEPTENFDPIKILMGN